MTVDPSTADRVRRVIREVLSVEVPSDDTDLIESGLIDSLALVTMIAEIEQEFGVGFALDVLEVEQFRSVDRIVRSLAKMAPAMI